MIVKVNPRARRRAVKRTKNVYVKIQAANGVCYNAVIQPNQRYRRSENLFKVLGTRNGKNTVQIQLLDVNRKVRYEIAKKPQDLVGLNVVITECNSTERRLVLGKVVAVRHGIIGTNPGTKGLPVESE